MSNVNAPLATRRYNDITDQVRQPHVINNKLIGAQSAETSSKEDGTIVGGILPTPLKGVIFLRDAKIDDPNVSRWQIVPEFDKIHIRSCMAGDRAPPVSDICDRMVSTYTPWRENISMPKYSIKHSEIYGFDQMFMSARTSYRQIPKLAQVFAEYE